MTRHFTGQLTDSGFLMVRGAVDDELRLSLIHLCAEAASSDDAPPDTRPGVRLLLRSDSPLREILESAPFVDLARLGLEGTPFAVRAILFQKTESTNWRVPWHQDLTIGVRERREAPGFHGWSIKAGVPHAQAPVDVLERILTLRIHLDACDESCGALEVLPGSHRRGRLPPEEITSIVREGGGVTCSASVGDVLIMRPLILHRSCPATAPSGRKVLHVEYSDSALPGGLRWW